MKPIAIVMMLILSVCSYAGEQKQTEEEKAPAKPKK